MKGYRYQSEFARTNYARGFAQGFVESLSERVAELWLAELPEDAPEKHDWQIAMAVAEKKLAEGMVQDWQRGVLSVLDARGLSVPQYVFERVLEEKDPMRLRRWLMWIPEVASLAEIFGQPGT